MNTSSIKDKSNNNLGSGLFSNNAHVSSSLGGNSMKSSQALDASGIAVEILLDGEIQGRLREIVKVYVGGFDSFGEE